MAIVKHSGGIGGQVELLCQKIEITKMGIVGTAILSVAFITEECFDLFFRTEAIIGCLGLGGCIEWIEEAEAIFMGFLCAKKFPEFTFRRLEANKVATQMFSDVVGAHLVLE